ncbi:MAG: PTS sugar transporter subunit IIA [Spirochaetes bacterium]|nr:PTS sugar transporter subunit IIA [Spirochaetota bacterium]
MKLIDCMDERAIILNIQDTDKEAVLSKIVDVLAQNALVSDKAEVERAILTRERLMSTGVGSGIAIPHAKTEKVDKITIAFATSRLGIRYKAVDKKNVHVIFMLIAPKDAASENLKILTIIAKILRGNTALSEKLLKAESPREVIDLIAKEEAKIQ